MAKQPSVMKPVEVDGQFVAMVQIAAAEDIHRLSGILQRYVGSIDAANASLKMGDHKCYRVFKRAANEHKVELAKWLSAKRTGQVYHFKSDMTRITAMRKAQWSRRQQHEGD
jgi:hypothetical protein